MNSKLRRRRVRLHERGGGRNSHLENSSIIPHVFRLRQGFEKKGTVGAPDKRFKVKAKSCRAEMCCSRGPYCLKARGRRNLYLSACSSVFVCYRISLSARPADCATPGCVFGARFRSDKNLHATHSADGCPHLVRHFTLDFMARPRPRSKFKFVT